MRLSRSIFIFALVLLLVDCPAAFSQDASGGEMVSLGAKTLSPACPVWVIGSYDSEGKPNVMTASWVGICCSKPPCVAISLREATYTHGNISKTGAFTVNVPSETHAAETAFFGRASGRDTDKFEATGFTAVKSDLVNAPYVGEFPVIFECKVIKTIELGLHTMFIGEIVDVKAAATVLGESGKPDIEKIRPFLFSPGNPDFFGAGASIGSIGELADEIKK